jgi:hypothetical protein
LIPGKKRTQKIIQILKEAKKMTTMEMNARRPAIDFDPDAIFEEYKARQRRMKRAQSGVHRYRISREANGVHRYRISREANAFTILLFGIGFLLFVIGLCTGLMTIPHGFVGWIATWVLAVALRAYSVTSVHSDETDYEPQYR